MTNTKKGASVRLQQQWKAFNTPQRVLNKILYKDRDRDGVPNKWDCQPLNPRKQDSKASLYHTGDILPSQKLRQDGKIWGFSSYNIAKHYQKVRNKRHIYQFITDNYILDNKQTMTRPVDNEYIAFNVLGEKQIE